MLRTLLVAVISIGMLSFVRAAPPATRPSSDVELQTLVYDISDLVRPRVNYPQGGGPVGGPMGMEGGAAPAMGGGMAAPQPVGPQRSDMADSLLVLIRETIDPTSWKDSGGEIGAMRELAGQLVVTQSRQNQEWIQKLLAEMRTQQGPAQMVCVRAYWLMLNAKDIESIFDATRKQAAGSASAMPTVSDSMVVGDKLYCQGQTICFNGQTVHITSGRQWSVVSKLNPVVGSNAVGYDPTMSVANSGVSLQVTPQIVPQTETAILDLRSTVTETRGPTGPIDLSKVSTTQPSDDMRAAAAGMIDRLNVVNQEFATTVRLPLGKKVLLGGMTLEPASQTDPGRQLYLVVELDAVK